MATWIAHLRIAEKLLENIPGLDANQFAIGNIAPDSGIPDEDWENFDPPKKVTHFLSDDNDADYVYLDIDFYRKFIDNEPKIDKDIKRFSFLLGYFFHLVTDNLWLQKIGRPSSNSYLAKFENQIKFSHEIKRDWYGIDFAYARNHPEGFFWTVFLDSQYSEPYLDFYPEEAIPKQLNYIKNFYQRVDAEIEENFRLSNNIYLTEDEVAEFVEESVQTLTKVYQLLWLQQKEFDANHSVLEILEG